ncbi:MAG: YbaB/EbfC family nucleoid-associated protein [Bacilli bacterium]
MNINQMMKQAQQMQTKMAKVQAELEAMEFKHEVNGALSIVVNGAKQVLKIDINQDLLEADNKEILEDMLLIGLNEVLQEVDLKTEQDMAKVTGNLKMPGFN